MCGEREIFYMFFDFLFFFSFSWGYFEMLVVNSVCYSFRGLLLCLVLSEGK